MSIGKKLKYARGNLMIIPEYETWLYKHSRELDEHLKIMYKIFDRPERVRTSSFSASAAGRCLRERSMKYFITSSEMGDKPNAQTMNIFVNGDFVHLRHQIAGIQMGYFTAAEVSVESPEWMLTGTMDADMKDGVIGEIKSINENGFRNVRALGPKPDHVEQVHAYMLCSGRDEARILYENKNTQEMAEFLIKRDQAVIDTVKSDLGALIKYVTKNKIIAVKDANCTNSRCVACKISDEEFASLIRARQDRQVRITRSKAASS